MSRFLVLCAAAALVGCESMTHNDGNTVSIRHEHIGTGWQASVAEMAAMACKDAGKAGAVHMHSLPARPGGIPGLGATVSTYRCTT